MEERKGEKDFVYSYLLLNKAKTVAKETKQKLKKMSERLLIPHPTVITSEIVERNVDIPLPITLHPYSSLKEQLLFKNNEEPKIIKPKSPYQEKHACKVNYVQQLSLGRSSELPKSTKDHKNNIDLVNVISKDTNKKDNSNCKINNLTVQQIPCVVIKPDLIIQRLTNIQIKPDNQNILNNKKQNVAYHEVMYEVEPETYECQTSQPKKTNDKTVARSEIRRILRGMLDDISLNVKSLSYSLISKLEKIMTNLEESNFLEHKDSNKVQNLVEEHSLVGFNEMVIKNKLLEMAESDDDKSFEQMAVELNNFYHQIDNRLINIQNHYLAINPSMEFPVHFEDKKLAGVANIIEENPQNIHPINTFQSKNFHDITSKNHKISVKEFLNLGSNSRMYKPEISSNLEEPDSETKIKL